jgi:hypothetical protein
LKLGSPLLEHLTVRKTAEKANVDRADVLVSLILVFPVFPGICSNFLGMLRKELEADENEKCYNY